jgi:hypothetical protein
MWYPSWEPLAEGDNSFNIRLGSDPNTLDDLPARDWLDVITDFWSQNAIRPSSLRRE